MAIDITIVVARVVAVASIQLVTGVHLDLDLIPDKTIKIINIVLGEQAAGRMEKYEVDSVILNEYNLIAQDNNLETIDFIGKMPFSLN